MPLRQFAPDRYNTGILRVIPMRKEGGAVTKEQKKATRQALRRYGAGSVGAAWARVIEDVLAYYDRHDPACAALLRLRYLQGLPEEKVIARLYVGRTTYYTKELEALSTVAVCAADAGLLPGGQMSGVF